MKDKRLILLMPFRSIIFILVFAAASAFTGKTLEDLSGIWSVAASIINIIYIAFLMFITRGRGGYKGLISYTKGRSKPKHVAGMIFLILLVGTGGMYLAGFICYGNILYASPAIITPIPVILAAINLIVLPVSTAMAEDALYLGCGVRQFDNKIAAIIVPAFFFALQHSFIPTLFDMRFVIYRFLSFLPLTVILSIHYRKHGDPLPIMVGHAVIDVATASMILATSAAPSFYGMMTGAAG